MRLLDLFCGAGGCSMGYKRAGFDVIRGVDKYPQPNYPFQDSIHYEDAIDYLYIHGKKFDVIHASPPCQAYSATSVINPDHKHEQLIPILREYLGFCKKPYIIENVAGAPLIEPTMLCGQMFGLNLYRHRYFETNFDFKAPPHPPHVKNQVKMGRKPKDDEIIQIVGHFSGVERARKEMGCEWMNRDELAQAIPPVYTEWIGKQIIGNTG